MKSRVLVLGYFGYVTNQIDGQTIKTRSIYDLLKSKKEIVGSVNLFDTQRFQQSKLSIFRMVWMILISDKLVYVPAHNNLKFLFPLIYIICSFMRINIFYFVVGGWLAEYLETKKLHVFFLSKIRAIFAESNQLCDILSRQYHFNNVSVFPNFRIHSFCGPRKKIPNDFKIVFMARINRMKGIEAVFRLASRIKERYDINHPISIDFYGSIDQKDDAYFREQIEMSSFVSYKGIVEPERVYDILTTYDVSILPTRYPTEGFPGTLLDAYISGIPVIVSNWKYSREFVKEGKTGFVFDLHKEEELFQYVNLLYNDRDLLESMKVNAFKESVIYSSESAWSVIKDHFEIK